MYGWRGRIGAIVSPPNTVVECEFAQMAPDGVSVHAARLGRPPGAEGPLTGDAVLQTNADLPRAASSLAELRLDVVVFAHTAGSMLGGIQYDQELTSMLEETVGCPAVTTASAAVAVLNRAGVRRLAVGHAPAATEPGRCRAVASSGFARSYCQTILRAPPAPASAAGSRSAGA